MPTSINSQLGQAIVFAPTATEDCLCNAPDHCLLFIPAQQVYSQFKIDPCGEVAVCNNSLGANLVTNGTFDADTDWTKGAGWTIGSGVATCASGSTDLSQTIAAGLTLNAVYILSYEVTAFTSGSLQPSVGGTNGTAVTAAGTYTELIIAGATDFLIFTSSAFLGSIDNVTLQLITSCWDEDNVTWETSEDGACHVAGNTTPLVNTGTVIELAEYYKVTFTVSGQTAGSVTLYLGLDPQSPAVTASGTYEYWGISNGTDISFVPTSAFDGCISALTVTSYCSDYLIHLRNEQGDLVYDMTNHYSYFEDTLNLEDFSFDDIALDYGCYTMCLIDCCYGDLIQFDDNIIDNGDFSQGATHWTSSGATFSGNKVTLDAGSGAYIEQAIKTTGAINCMNLTLGYVNEGSGNIIVYIDGVNSYSAIVTGIGSLQYEFDYEIPAGAVIKIEGQGLTQPLDIDNVVLSVPDRCRTYDQCSPCLKYDASFDCTKMIEAYCPDSDLGFQFDDTLGANYFKLSLRVACDLLHASYEQDQEDYIFSSGSSSLHFGQSTKYQSLFFNPIATYKHDVIALQKICDTFLIDSVEYFVKKGDYNPEWNRNDATDLAPSRIPVKKKTETRFNTNCE